MRLNPSRSPQIFLLIGVLINEAQFALRSSGNPPKMEAIHGNARTAVHTFALLLPSALPRLVFCLAAASKFASRFPIARFVVQLETPRSRWSLSEALSSKLRDRKLSSCAVCTGLLPQRTLSEVREDTSQCDERDAGRAGGMRKRFK
ncbi:hypothetical protein Q8A67_013850 [Cirrhinus molitorella]|uniref:Uncharacterized protein n=1 Tax=Cirrhinus molitorella TaxID=172907 RepID=A0AA88TNU0_9TELE|nr:hypothetical protein Q8A67_013850 [Cirrhinus molitorella]